jgi:hypothetical protein
LFPTSLKTVKDGGENDVPPLAQQSAISAGTIVEFREKKRAHLGRIREVERKSNGWARYDVEEYPSGKHFSIADKDVSFTIPVPTNEKQEEKLLEQLDHAFNMELSGLCKALDISPGLLELAWQEKAESECDEDMILTPSDLVLIVLSHKASQVERYEAWRLLRSEIGHVFFKEISEHGRVVAFRAKPKKSVHALRDVYCISHDDDDFCDVDEILLRP